MSPETTAPASTNSDALELAADVARVGLWNWDLISGQLTLDSRSAAALRVARIVDAEPFLAKAIHPDDLIAFRAALSHAMSSPHPANQHVRLVEQDGTTRLVDLRMKAAHDAAGKAVRLVTAVADIISEDSREAMFAQQAETQRSLAERLSVATQAAGVYMWEFDWSDFKLRWDDSRPTGGAGPRHFARELGDDFHNWVHPEDRFCGAKAMQDALDRGESDSSFRYRLNLPDGTMRHIQAYARTYIGPQGTALRSLGVSWDVTNEVLAAAHLAEQAEEQLATKRRLERASASIHEGHWEIDWIAARHWASSNYYALLGYQPDEIEFDTFEKLDRIIHPDDLAAVKAAIDRHINDGSRLYDTEVRIAVKQGGYVWFRLRGSAEREAGRVVRMAGSIQNIQKQKIAENALRVSQERFDRAVHGTQDGLWEADMLKGHMWLSPRAHMLLGYEEDELPDHLDVLRERIHPDDIIGANEILVHALDHGLPLDQELRLSRKDGSYRSFRVRGTPELTLEGRVHRMSGSMQDVTDARAARDALIEASEAAQAASRSKSAFIANVSHEIRTPMNGIIGMTSLLLDTPLERSQREYADTIRSSADALLTVINDILDFSKIEAGKLDIDSIEMDLPANVEEVGSTLAFQAAAKGLELIIHVHPDVPSNVIGDPQRIRQCLINLVGNAIKFTPVGEVAVEVSMVNAAAAATPLVRFEVRDTGIGIAPEVLESLFQPFVQADVSTTRNFGGTGLGLSIVRRLVELMGGEVGVSSSFGKGSTFWFVLPLRPGAVAETPAPTVESRANRRVLVVDDNETNRRVLATRLAHAGYEVELASSGREAIDTMRLANAAARGFDLVLSDFQMPDMDGAMLGERIHTDPSLANVRLVLLTSVDRQGDLSRFASLGFAGYLSKPIRARELLACIDKVFEHDAQEWHAQTHPIVTANSLPRPIGKPFSGRVLLVEDNVVNQKVGQRFLERLGCEVVLAENGQEAVDAWKAGSFRLVLMDVQMPVMDGYTATRCIRDLEKGRGRTPIVALTANAMTGQLERCLQSGMDGLLTKPLEPQRLEEVLERFGLSLPEEAFVEPARA